MLRQIFLFLIVVCFAVPSHAAKNACRDEVQRGEASWYGPGFEGAKTTKGEAFDPDILSAAHPKLPFGTLLKVLNLRNQKSAYVRVNDRGGFGKSRVIDVSQAAAKQLDMIETGTAAVAIFRCSK